VQTSPECALKSLKTEVESPRRLNEARGAAVRLNEKLRLVEQENQSNAAFEAERLRGAAEELHSSKERFVSELAAERLQHQEQEQALKKLLEDERAKAARQTSSAARRACALEAQATNDRVQRQSAGACPAGGAACQLQTRGTSPESRARCAADGDGAVELERGSFRQGHPCSECARRPQPQDSAP